MSKTKKTYGIYKMISFSAVIPTGENKHARVEFQNGVISARGMEPATFSTANADLQEAIENCKLFKDEIIKIVKTQKIDDEIVEGPNDKIEDDGNVYAEVTNSQGAKAILMGEPYTVALEQLQNKDAIKAKAAELNIKFPNWK
jgi:hypothetical protein